MFSTGSRHLTFYTAGGGSLDILQRVTPCHGTPAEAPLEFLQSMTPRHGSLAEAPLEFPQMLTGLTPCHGSLAEAPLEISLCFPHNEPLSK